jgi:hypothetical protein
VRGFQARKVEKARLVRLRELVPRGNSLLGVGIPPGLYCPIRELQKYLIDKELESAYELAHTPNKLYLTHKTIRYSVLSNSY